MSQMLTRRSVQLVPAIVFLFVVALVWQAWSHDVVYTQAAAYSRSENDPSQSVLGVAPYIELSRESSQLLSIQNSTLGVCVAFTPLFFARTPRRKGEAWQIIPNIAWGRGASFEYIF